MMKKILLIIAGVIFLSEVVQAQTMRFNSEQYIDEDGDTLNYRIAFPDFSGSETYPVVIFLHGGGERGNDNTSQLKWGVQNFVTDHAMMTHKAIVLAPQNPENSTWSNFEEGSEDDNQLRLADEPSKPLKMTMELLDQLIESFSVDTSRIYITGMSMGGYGTWDAIARWPERFAAAVPVCGGGDPSTAKRIAHIPIWATHGADDTIVSPEMSRQMIEALQEAGGMPGYSEYPGVGHFSWLQTYTDDYLISWMFSQRKE